LQFRLITALLATAFAANAHATTILSGQTLATSVAASSSIYQVFGHSGSSVGGAATDAVMFNFAAGAGNIFHFSASGLSNCCNGSLNTPPDGGPSGGTNVIGQNGLSNAFGNSQLPLLGVFTSETDPFGGAAPAALGWNTGSGAAVSPLLNQVFFIGDGKAGYNNPLGAALEFLAPSGATRLYLGVADGWAYSGTSGYYSDNRGQYSVSVELAADPADVPEPASLGLLGLGLAGMIATRRRKAP
jgi:hypothetical protein